MSVFDDVTAALAARGLDLAAPMAACDYDAVVPEGLRLPGFERTRALAIVVGNTRALWSRVVDALDGEQPLDRWVMAAVTSAVEAAIAPGTRWTVRWAHHVPATVAIQRAAAVAGLAYLAPSHLCVHPEYGPWIALRAVVVLDVDGPDLPVVPVAAPCDCARGCGPALSAALAAGEPSGTAELRERWRLWLAVRDACPVGRDHRYSDEQILFHYAGLRPR